MQNILMTTQHALVEGSKAGGNPKTLRNLAELLVEHSREKFVIS